MTRKGNSAAETAARRERIVSATYPVGYGKAPKASRWAKGQSGNPGGPKVGVTKARLIAGLLEALDANVEHVSHGTTTRIPFHKAFGLKVVQLAMRASGMSELERMLGIIDKFGLLQEAARPPLGADKEHLQIVRDYLRGIGVPVEAIDALITEQDALRGADEKQPGQAAQDEVGEQ